MVSSISIVGFAILTIAMLIANRSRLVNLSIVSPSICTFALWMLLLFWIANVLFTIDQRFFATISDHLFIKQINPLHPEVMVVVALLSGFSFLFGLILASRLDRQHSLDWSRWYREPIVTSDRSNWVDRHFWHLFLIACVMVFVYVSIIGGVSSVPLFVLIRGERYIDIVTAREESFKLLPRLFAYPFHMLRLIVFPFLVCYGYLSARVTSGSSRKWARFVIVAIVGLLFSASSTAHGPTAELVIQLCLCEIFLARGSRKRAVLVYVFALAVVITLVLGQIALWPDSSFDVSAEAIKIVSRKAIGKGFALFMDLAMFTNTFAEEPNIGFSGIPKIARLLGLEPFSIGNELYLYSVPSARVRTGTCNGPWFCYDYVCFGYIGVLLGSAAVGFVLGKLNLFFATCSKDKVVIVLFVFTIVAATGLFDTAPTRWLVSQGGILGALALLIITRLAGSYRVSHKYVNNRYLSRKDLCQK